MVPSAEVLMQSSEVREVHVKDNLDINNTVGILVRNALGEILFVTGSGFYDGNARIANWNIETVADIKADRFTEIKPVRKGGK